MRLFVEIGFLLAASTSQGAVQQGIEIAAPSQPETGDPEARRKALNEEQAAKASLDLQRYSEQRSAREAAMATANARSERDEAAYVEAVRRYELQVDEYRKATEKWQLANPGCDARQPVCKR